jgi:hypothetical protein
MIKTSTASLVAAALMISLGGCAGGEREALPVLSDTKGASLHTVKSQTLKSVMHDLNNVVFDRFYSEIDRDNMRVRYSKNIADIVASMSGDIEKIRQTGNELNLAPKERALFDALAAELAQEGESLRLIATEYQTERIRPALDRMIDVCNRCHAAFRDGKRGE